MRDSDVALAQRLADLAGDAIRPLFRAGVAVEKKSDTSPVTEADRAAEAAMRRLIEAEHPRDGIIGEEYGDKPSQTGRTWVLDPIDGTISFTAGRAIFGTLIALLEDDWPVLGVIDQPIARDRWIGAIGRETTLNGQAARSRLCRELSGAILATSSPHYFFDESSVAAYLAIASKVDRLRIVYGGDCYNYGLLASGHLDLVVESGLKLHDFAALVPIVEGAGGTMCDWAGDPLNRDSKGDVIALGDPARLEGVLEALAV
ncbi:histidinol-phosphatase [Sphingomonas antarctica]|uniref:inositol monophosphatase family protein n=1 Tax=Sphingomonas antarctica TaxID=2040274 RepID=UPI0039EC44BB